MEGEFRRSPEREPSPEGLQEGRHTEGTPSTCHHTPDVVALVSGLPPLQLLTLARRLREARSVDIAQQVLARQRPFTDTEHPHRNHLWVLLLNNCPICQRAALAALVQALDENLVIPNIVSQIPRPQA